MNRSRRTVEPPVGVTVGLTGPSNPNRLRRSFRRTQTAADGGSPKRPQPDFKTPTRIPRPRAGAGFSAESPNNDSDFQQDIVWDATSPSPGRPGKKGKKPPGAVDISDIVNRIAPKHGRPAVSEPTLQQWIGDSAAIPCTPDAQGPKPKKKSPRPNGVDDLLKLAKQFDFNMFRRDEEEEEEEGADERRRPELQSEDANPSAASLPASHGPAERRPDPLAEDDLDFLFNGPTQLLSGSLSPGASARPAQVQPASREAAGKPAAPTHGAAAARDEFEDDWENDDLLTDSLLLEMTQNPQSGAGPRLSSTQKPLGEARRHRESPASGAVHAAPGGRQRATFTLEPNPNASFQRIQTNPTDRGAAAGDAPQNRSSAREPPVPPRASDPTASAAGASRSSPTASRGAAAPALPDEEDLSSFFSADPVWDDPADDHLLCEMCESLESRLQSAESASAGRPSERGAPPPAGRRPLGPERRAAAAGGSGGAAGVRLTEAFRDPHAKHSSGSTNGSAWSRRVPPAFKKPNNPVTTVTSDVVAKCSAAEIELKKQRAMERRRQRLQGARNLRAPT